jgi:tripartite-type tricarboxylate transporter receptor subunit TctC
MLISGSHVTIPLLHKKVPFDAMGDFAPVATLTSSELLLAAAGNVPARTVAELVALSRRRPGELTYASAGAGGPSHLAAEYFNILTGADLRNVAYRGSGPAVTDLLGGHVALYFGPPALLTPHIKAGTVRALAISGEQRLAALPDVPTFGQAGIADFDVRNWYGVLAPRGTPLAVIVRLNAEINAVLGMADVAQKLETLGLAPFRNSPQEMADLMKKDQARYANVISTAKIAPN